MFTVTIKSIVVRFRDSTHDGSSFGRQVALSALESTCRQQKEASSSLRQELRLQKQLQQDAQAAVDEAKTLREKLSRLRAVSDIIDGTGFF